MHNSNCDCALCKIFRITDFIAAIKFVKRLSAVQKKRAKVATLCAPYH